MRGVFPFVWLSPRGIWGLGIAAILYAVACIVPWFLEITGFWLFAFIVFLILDLRYAPGASAVRIAREPIGRLVLGKRYNIVYDIENDMPLPLRIGLFETPVPGIAFESTEAGTVLKAHSRLNLEQTFITRSRGAASFGAFYVWMENGIGLLRRRYVIAAHESVDIFPDLSAVERYGVLASRRTLPIRGLRKLRLRGVGSEFESMREYVPGDAFRSINWKASARRGCLIAEQYEVERSAQVLVLLDCGRLMTARMGEQRKFDYVLTGALSAAHIACAADDQVGLHAFAARSLLSFAPRRGRAHVAAITQAVFDLQPRREEPDYELAFVEIEQRYTKRGVIVFFTDIFDPVTSAGVLNGLKRLAKRHAVLCVLMNDGAVADALAVRPQTREQAYRFGAAAASVNERAGVAAQLRAYGVIVLDVPASRLTFALPAAYLEARGRL